MIYRSNPGFGVRLAALAALVVSALALIGGAPAQAATVPAHPFSNPVAYPLATPALMGCYKGNPSVPSTKPSSNCTSPLYHTYWAMDLISLNPKSPSADDPLEPVYAMGAGIAHVGMSGLVCDGTQSRGNFIYIDHGTGVLSYYGHLGTIRVTEGEYVTARTQIGTIGNSGYANCFLHPYYRYLYLAVKHGGTSGTYTEIPTMTACVNGVARSWPSALPDQTYGPFTRWNQVPARQPLPAPTDRLCLPVPPPTPLHPTGNRLVRAGSGHLRAWWAGPPATAQVNSIYVQFQEYHPSIHQWLDYANRTLRPALRATTYALLANGRLYRVRISFANAAGRSAPTAWLEGTPAA